MYERMLAINSTMPLFAYMPSEGVKAHHSSTPRGSRKGSEWVSMALYIYYAKLAQDYCTTGEEIIRDRILACVKALPSEDDQELFHHLVLRIFADFDSLIHPSQRQDGNAGGGDPTAEAERPEPHPLTLDPSPAPVQAPCDLNGGHTEHDLIGDATVGVVPSPSISVTARTTTTMAKDYYPRAKYDDDDDATSNAPATVSLQAACAQSTAMRGLDSQNALGLSIYAQANTAGLAGCHTMAFQRTFKAAPGLNIAIPAPAPAPSARAAGKRKAERSLSPLDLPPLYPPFGHSISPPHEYESPASSSHITPPPLPGAIERHQTMSHPDAHYITCCWRKGVGACGTRIAAQDIWAHLQTAHCVKPRADGKVHCEWSTLRQCGRLPGLGNIVAHVLRIHDGGRRVVCSECARVIIPEISGKKGCCPQCQAQGKGSRKRAKVW